MISIFHISENQRVLIVKFSRYGLANKLITWAKAYVWSRNNGAKLVVKGWFHIPIGNILRREKNLRLYYNFFKTNNFFFSLLRKSHVICTIHDKPQQNIKVYQLKTTPYISDFIELMNYRDEIKNNFINMIRKKYLDAAKTIHAPIIGVHIRRGDFVKIGSSTELTYYMNVIDKIRLINNNLPVTIFSDGFEHELTPILKLPDTCQFKSINDLVDLLVLSKSRILITSLSSSYSYWAAFLSEGIILHHPKTWVTQCRPSHINSLFYEGVVPEQEEWPINLINNIKSITD